MKPSGLNSIEFILSILVGLWKIAGWIVLIIVVGPVLYLLWSWNTMSYQAKTIHHHTHHTLTTHRALSLRC